MANKIYITNNQKKLAFLPSLRVLIRKAVNATLKSEGVDTSCEVSVTIVDNQAIKEMNSEYRNIDSETDVLSFPMFDDDFGDGECQVLGDIVISLERAALQAEEYGHTLEREVAFLTVHSVLHLLGYDHEVGKAEESEMFEKQKKILDAMGLSRDR